MKNQRNQMIALVVLVIGWALYWHFYIKMPKALVAAKAAAAAKVIKSDSLLQQRFHKVRAEMDALYHYRISPTAFDGRQSPFRIQKGMDGAAGMATVAVETSSKASPSEQGSSGPQPPDVAEKVLKTAIAAMRIGGVVSMNGTIQLTVDGQLHKEGDEFTAKVPNAKGHLNSVLIKD